MTSPSLSVPSHGMGHQPLTGRLGRSVDLCGWESQGHCNDPQLEGIWSLPCHHSQGLEWSDLGQKDQ